MKILGKLGREEPLQVDKEHLTKKPTVNIILDGTKLKAFLLRSGTRQGYSFLPAFQYHSRSPR